eukprot:SM000059S18684  [mRNA]  locus=s59:303535:308861:- [translate_table: standard]
MCNLWVDKENDCRIAPGWDHDLRWPRRLPSVGKLDKQCPTAVHKVKPGQVDEDEANKLQRLQLHALRVLEYLPCIDGEERGLAMADPAQGRVRGRDVVEAAEEEEAAREVEQRVVVAVAPRHPGQEVSRLLTSSESDGGEAVHAFASARLREPVLRTLADESPSVAAAALRVVQQLARSPEGLAELFPMESEVNTLTDMAITGPVTVRLRALEAAASLASVSEEAAAAVRDAGISAAAVRDLEDSDDILARVATLELLGQLASTTIGARIVAAADLTQRLAVILRDKDEDELIRIHALLIAARLLSMPLDAPSGPSTSDAQAVVQAMEACIVQSQAGNEIEQPTLTLEQATFDAIEQIAKAAQSAELLLVPPGRLVRQVSVAAFKSNLDTHRLAAVDALSSIAGYYREDGAKLLKADAEAVLQDAIYSAATAGPGPLTLGGALESLVRQPSSESSHAGYRLLTALVYRTWAVMDICSSRTLLDTLTKPQVEVSIKDFQLRQSACQAVAFAAAAALEGGSVQLPQHVVDELHEAARTKARTSESGTARPVVATMER